LHDTDGNKKIAVLADMLELGEYSKQAHLSVGEMVAENKIDYLLCFGNDAKYYCQSAKENGVSNAFLFDDKDSLSEKLIDIASKGDSIIFKGSRGMKLEDVINKVCKRWENNE
jgi:UDP-N-acetylmuramoyl-tripeptide--D-alanyl-D-alanine ligase